MIDLLQRNLKYFISAFIIINIFFFLPLNKTALSLKSQTPRMLSESEARRITNLILQLYRSNILKFTADYENYYSKQKQISAEKLANLFKRKVLGSLSLVESENWKLPQFIFMGDSRYVVNRNHLPSISDADIIEKIMNSGTSGYNEKEQKRYKIGLTIATKEDIKQTLFNEEIYVARDKENKNFIIAIKLIPDEVNIRSLFDDTKENCIHCHLNVRALYRDDEQDGYGEQDNDAKFLHNVDKKDYDINGAIVFEIPIEQKNVKQKNNS